MTAQHKPAEHGRGEAREALSCAFCGSDAAYHTHGGVWRQHHVFYCPTVDCPAHRNVRDAPSPSCGEGYSYPTKDEALAAWNKRDAAIAALTQPKGDGMLPDALVPHSKEWYRLCELRFTVDRMTISGKLAEAIVEAVGQHADVSLPRQSEAEDSGPLAEAYRRDMQASRAVLSTPQPAQAATTPAAPVVGDGMVVVPREATQPIRQAYYDHRVSDCMWYGDPVEDDLQRWANEAYAAMIQAASAPGGE